MSVLCIFQQYFSYVMVISFYICRKPKYFDKATNLSQVMDKIYQIKLCPICLLWETNPFCGLTKDIVCKLKIKGEIYKLLINIYIDFYVSAREEFRTLDLLLVLRVLRLVKIFGSIQRYYMYWYYIWFEFMLFNTTFNNISAISWWSVLLVEETGKNHRPVASHWQTLSHNVVSSSPCRERGSNSQL